MCCENLQINRSNYVYPAVALEGDYNNPEIVHFEETVALDEYIHNLLLAPDITQKVLGYLSVVFWGFYSGQDGVIREERALSKVALARDGRNRVVRGRDQRMRGVIDLGEEYVGQCISNAIFAIEADNYSEAIRTLNQLPQLQIAFSSKVCAFLDPLKCGVIDSVIAENRPEFGFDTDAQGIIKNRTSNRELYNRYCVYLQAEAERINNFNPPCLWQDRDGTVHSWRALDVERSMY